MIRLKPGVEMGSKRPGLKKKLHNDPERKNKIWGAGQNPTAQTPTAIIEKYERTPTSDGARLGSKNIPPSDGGQVLLGDESAR